MPTKTIYYCDNNNEACSRSVRGDLDYDRRGAAGLKITDHYHLTNSYSFFIWHQKSTAADSSISIMINLWILLLTYYCGCAIMMMLYKETENYHFLRCGYYLILCAKHRKLIEGSKL